MRGHKTEYNAKKTKTTGVKKRKKEKERRKKGRKRGKKEQKERELEKNIERKKEGKQERKKEKKKEGISFLSLLDYTHYFVMFSFCI